MGRPKKKPGFDEQKAQHAVDFINYLKHTKGEWYGQPFILIDWQEKIIRDVFGTMKPTGYRQYNTAYVEIPKKQGKSELAAAVALLLTCGDGEWGAEVYGCASDRQQASIVFDVAVEMVDQCPPLKKRIKPVLSQKRLVYKPLNSFYQVLSAEAYTKHGLNAHGVVFDELHAQPNRELWDVMTFGAGDARRQPLWWIITTAGDDPDRISIGWEVHQKARDILLGNRNDPNWYPVIYGIEPDENRVWKGWTCEQIGTEADWKEQWKERKIWTAVNPSLGHTVLEEKLEEAFINVVGNDAEERLFRQLRLNEWVRYKASKWLSLTKWDETAGKVSWEECLGLKCYGGLDLSSSTDTTSFCLLFPPSAKYSNWRALWRVWIPEDNLKERVRRDHVPYDRWLKEGYIKTTPGNVIDYDFVESDIMGLAKKYELLEIGYDPWHALQTSVRLTDEGLTMAEVRQGFKTLGPAMKELKELTLGQQLVHGGNPVIRWMFGNIEIKMDENENVRPVKGKGIEKIDGIVALINALDRAMRYKEPKKPGIVAL